MATMQRDLGEHQNQRTTTVNDRADSINNIQPSETQKIDCLVIGAGFAGCYLLHKLRKEGFNAKIVEAGTDLGGIWHWNAYPGARVDSQYPIYALSLPEVYEDWTWSSHYPDHVELRQYFAHVDRKLGIKKDTIFNSKVTDATFDEENDCWVVECDSGVAFETRWLIASVGFAAKRYFPDWDGLDTFQGVMHHSSFWPHEGVNVSGKRCAVVGTGATGVQISQEWAHEIGDDGSLIVLQRTPNLCCPMNQVFLSAEEQEEDKKTYPEVFNQRWGTYNGFLYQYQPELMMDANEAEREEMFDKLWKMGGFRFLMHNYYDMTRELKANRIAYEYWKRRVRERIHDPRKADLLAPTEPPHAFGGKRLSLEQDFYDSFNKPNVDVIDIKSNPIVAFEPNGIRQADGTVHELDVIALATGFDAINGGLKDIKMRGLKGELLTDKWKEGTWTYLGMMTSRFPNFCFTYGPQGPTAFSNGPSCVELQGDWMVNLFKDMREAGRTRVDPKEAEEKQWKVSVNEYAVKGVRGHTNSWYNGSNIPGKPIEALNYAGGIPMYLKAIGKERDEGYPGFHLQ